MYTAQQLYNLFGITPPVPPTPPFGQWTQPYNSQQLASYQQARVLAAAINATKIMFVSGDPRPMGEGVLPGDDETVTDASGVSSEPHLPATGQPGIYMMDWSAVPGAGPEASATGPDGTKYYPLLLRFQSGHSGMNVGLILNMFSRYPLSPAYVIGFIATEAEGVTAEGVA
jgi:hypothetical protein